MDGFVDMGRRPSAEGSDVLSLHPERSRVCKYYGCDCRKQVVLLGVNLCMFRGTGIRLVSKVKITSRL